MAEPVVQLIQIIRQLQGYNVIELCDWINNASKIFSSENAEILLKKILITGLSKHFKDISNNLFTQLIELNENNQTTDDSINIHMNAQTLQEKSDKSSDTVSKFDFVTLNEDLEMYICRFLPLSDLPNVSATCRHFCLIARHPCSISNININTSKTIHDINYTHNRYSKISTLKLQTNNHNKCELNTRWNESIELLNITDYCMFQTELSIYSDTFPVCININKFSYSGSLSYFWISNKINRDSVTILHLRHFVYDKNFLDTIITLTQIKELSLKWMLKFNDKENTVSDTFQTIKELSQYKTRANGLFPFKRLQIVEYESHEVDTKRDELKLFICWILCNIKKKTIFKYIHNCSNEYDLFDSYTPFYQSQTEQFKNMNKIIFKGCLAPFLVVVNSVSNIISGYNQYKKFELIDLNLTLWDKNNFRLNEYEFGKSLNLTKSLNILVKHSNYFKLRAKFFIVNLEKFNVIWFQQWAYNIIDESKTFNKQKTFDEIIIIARIQRNIAVDIIKNIMDNFEELTNGNMDKRDAFIDIFMNQVMNIMKAWTEINKQIKDKMGIKILKVELKCFETFGKQEEKQFEIDEENEKYKNKDEIKLDEMDEYNDDNDGFEDFEDDINDYDGKYDEEIDQLIVKEVNDDKCDPMEVKIQFIEYTKLLEERISKY